MLLVCCSSFLRDAHLASGGHSKVPEFTSKVLNLLKYLWLFDNFCRTCSSNTNACRAHHYFCIYLAVILAQILLIALGKQLYFYFQMDFALKYLWEQIFICKFLACILLSQQFKDKKLCIYYKSILFFEIANCCCIFQKVCIKLSSGFRQG